jgi:hypothetical protein
MKALHIHRYTSNPPWSPNPLETVATDASAIIDAAHWYRDTYNDENPLPMDILLSEFGLHWDDENNETKRWAGWFDNMRDGLSWWNSYLCWIMRHAPDECDLQAGYHLYATIHNPTAPPYTLQAATLSAVRNQGYYNASNQTKAIHNNMQSINTQTGIALPNGTTYQGKFTTFPTINWQVNPIWDPWNRQWRRTPFGACYTVWAAVGTDPQDVPYSSGVGGLNAGWVASKTPGSAGGPGNTIPLTATVTLPVGWSTIYFPVIKGDGQNISGDEVRFTITTPATPTPVELGTMLMSDFADSGLFTAPSQYYPPERDQYINSAMIYPVVCSNPSQASITITINLEREHFNAHDEEVLLGRPIVLRMACSWFIEQ